MHITKHHRRKALAVAVLSIFALPAAGVAQVAQTTAAGGYIAVCGWSSGQQVAPSCTAPVAPGGNAAATGGYAMALGEYSIASGLQSVAIGVQSTASSLDGVAIGSYAFAGTGDAATDPTYGATAVGWSSYAPGTESVALGMDAAAVAGSSAAIGANSLADEAGTVSVGNDGSTGGAVFQSRIVNVGAGLNPFDAVNLAQLDTAGNALAGWIGGGASFEAAGAGAFTAPAFVLTNPYTPGSYNSVSGAIVALDRAIADVPAGSTGATGPAGPRGAMGPQGPAGKDGTNATGGGTGADPLAVHYDSTAQTSVTLDPAGHGQTTIHNVAAGVAPSDAANVSQIDEALRSANAYTDLRSVDTLNSANAYTDMRVGQLNDRVNYALAAAASNANAAAAVAAQDPAHRNRVAVSDGLAAGVNAWTFMYQHRSNGGVTWNASLTGEQGASSTSERQVGVGVGYSW